MCSLLLVGCSLFQAPAPAWPANVPPRNVEITTAPITLKVWLAADYTDTPPVRDLIRDFEQAYPNIKIETTSNILWEEMLGKVELAVSQGVGPDIAHGHAFVFGAQGLADPIDDLWREWNTENEFMPGAMEDVLWKGHYFGVPLDINTLFTIYNKRLFKEARLPEPSRTWTLDDLQVLAPRLTKPDGSQYAIALSSSGWALSGWVYAAGGDLVTERDGKIIATLNDPAVLEMLQLNRKMGLESRVGTLPPPIVRQSDHPVTLFREGKVAMFFSGPWDLARLRNEAPDLMSDVGTAPLPRGAGTTAGGSVQGGGSLVIPRGAKHREAAFEFMKWMVAPPYAKRMALEQGRFPVRTDMYNDPDLRQDPLLTAFYDQLKRARPYKLEAYRNANDTWSEIVKSAFEPNVDLERLVSEAQITLQQQIDEVELAAQR